MDRREKKLMTSKIYKDVIQAALHLNNLKDRANFIHSFAQALYDEGYTKFNIKNINKLYELTEIPEKYRKQIVESPISFGGDNEIGGNDVAFLPVDYPPSTRIDIVNFPTGFQHPKRKTKYKPMLMYMDMNKRLYAIVHDKEGEVFHISEADFRISKPKKRRS